MTGIRLPRLFNFSVPTIGSLLYRLKGHIKQIRQSPSLFRRIFDDEFKTNHIHDIFDADEYKQASRAHRIHEILKEDPNALVRRAALSELERTTMQLHNIVEIECFRQAISKLKGIRKQKKKLDRSKEIFPPLNSQLPIEQPQPWAVYYPKSFEHTEDLEKQPFWIPDPNGSQNNLCYFWLGTPTERYLVARRRPTFPENYIDENEKFPSELWSDLENWTIFEDAMMGGRSFGKLEVLCNGIDHKNLSTSEKADMIGKMLLKWDKQSLQERENRNKDNLFKVVERLTTQDIEHKENEMDSLSFWKTLFDFEWKRFFQFKSNRFSNSQRIVELLFDSEHKGVSILRFSGYRVTPSKKQMVEASQVDELQKVDEDVRYKMLKLDKKSRPSRLSESIKLFQKSRLNSALFGQVACMSPTIDPTLDVNDMNSFKFICRALAPSDNDFVLPKFKKDQLDPFSFVPSWKLCNPEHQKYWTGHTRTFEVRIKHVEDTFGIERFYKGYIKVPEFIREVGDIDNVWAEIELPLKYFRAIDDHDFPPEVEHLYFYRPRFLGSVGFVVLQDGPFTLDIRGVHLTMLPDLDDDDLLDYSSFAVQPDSLSSVISPFHFRAIQKIPE